MLCTSARSFGVPRPCFRVCVYLYLSVLTRRVFQTLALAVRLGVALWRVNGAAFCNHRRVSDGARRVVTLASVPGPESCYGTGRSRVSSSSPLIERRAQLP